MNRRDAVAALVALSAAPLSANAQAKPFPIPGKPIRIVVPFPAGGGTDIVTRPVAQKFSESLGVPVIVDNKPGASTLIGTVEVMKAAPDGHTLLSTIGIITQLPQLYKTPPFDLFHDFTPLTTIALAGTVFTAHMSVPANNLKELIAYAKSNPGKLNYASFGPGTVGHLNGETLKRLTGIEIVHVPYKGSADLMKDHLSGEVQLSFDGPANAMINAKSGKVKILAAATETRISALPDVPTFREQGIALGFTGFNGGFFGPANMSPEPIKIVTRELIKAISTPEIKKIIIDGGNEPAGMPQVEFTRLLRTAYDNWGVVIREVGVRLD